MSVTLTSMGILPSRCESTDSRSLAQIAAAALDISTKPPGAHLTLAPVFLYKIFSKVLESLFSVQSPPIQLSQDGMIAASSFEIVS